VELPSDSTFAIAMKNQQQAEKEEQQRIKNLVLNYDMQQSEDQEAVSNERPGTFYHNRIDRPTKDRGQRTRKLQLSDVDW
jgi:regulator of nonsense transcripts 2